MKLFPFGIVKTRENTTTKTGEDRDHPQILSPSPLGLSKLPGGAPTHPTTTPSLLGLPVFRGAMLGAILHSPSEVQVSLEWETHIHLAKARPPSSLLRATPSQVPWSSSSAYLDLRSLTHRLG